MNHHKRALVVVVIICVVLFFAFVPFVHHGATGPVPYSTHPSNYVYVSLSCISVGLGASFWGGHYQFGCVPMFNGGVVS